MKRSILIGILIIACIFIWFRQKNKNYYDLINAVSGATPLAVAADVPDDFSLTVNGLTKQEYRFTSSALNGFASTRIRTLEISGDGEFVGAYVYNGIPVFNILEGIAPEKPEPVLFDQPVDMVVTFSSDSGRSVRFSYNEIIMVDDSLPVTLAYQRRPIEPTTEKVRETYDKNRFTKPLDSLRLITPKDPDNSRYLDHVTTITLSMPDVPDKMLPPRVKKSKCTSHSIFCIDNNAIRPASFENINRIRKEPWVMISHGHGYDRTVSVEGFDLRSFLTENFTDIKDSDFFLFAACDGYRSLYSAYEIFRNVNGASMMIADTVNDQPSQNGFRLALTADFFTDRSMWGVSHVLRLRESDL